MNRVLLQNATRTVATFHRAQLTPKGRQDVVVNVYKVTACCYSIGSKGTDHKAKEKAPVPLIDEMSELDDILGSNIPPTAPSKGITPAHSSTDDFTHSKTSDGITNSMNHFADIVAAAAKLSVPAIDKNAAKKSE